MEMEKIWEKHGLSVKSVYFNSGSVLTQAMIGGNIALSDSGVPEMLVLPVSGAFDTKVITVNINRLEHIFVTRKNIVKADDLKRQAHRRQPIRFGLGSSPRAWCYGPGRSIPKKT